MRAHTAHFLVLLAILLGGAYAVFALKGNPNIQLWVEIIISVLYMVWGLIHHIIQKDLHPKVVVEYVLIGSIAIAVLMIVLGR